MIKAGDAVGVGCRRGRDRARRVPDLRFVLRHVHGEFDELSDRGAGPVPAGQRHRRRHPQRPQGAVPWRRPPDRRDRQAPLRAGRLLGAATLDRDQGSLRKRDGTGRVDGRLDQHRAAPAGRRARSGSGVHDGRHRPHLAPGALPVQGRADDRQIPHRGRAPRRRHLLDPGRAGAGRFARHVAADRPQPDHGRRDCEVRRVRQR